MSRQNKYNPEEKKAFAGRLKELLASKNKSQFAKDLGVSYESIRRWCSETGSMPDGADLIGINRLLDVSLDWLLLGKEPVVEVSGSAEELLKQKEESEKMLDRYEKLIGNYTHMIDSLQRRVEQLETFISANNKKTRKGDPDNIDTGKLRQNP